MSVSLSHGHHHGLFSPPPHAVLCTPTHPPPTPTLAPSAYSGPDASFFTTVLRTPLKRRETNLVAFHLLLTTLPPAPIPVSVSCLLDIIILPPVAQADCRAWGEWGGGDVLKWTAAASTSAKRAARTAGKVTSACAGSSSYRWRFGNCTFNLLNSPAVWKLWIECDVLMVASAEFEEQDGCGHIKFLSFTRKPCCCILNFLKFVNSCGCMPTALDMLRWREMTEQTGWRTKQPLQLACVSEDLKCWGAWDTTCWHKAKNMTPPIIWRR